MVGFIVSWLIATVAILVAAYVIPGIRVDTVGSALLGAAILGVLNAIVKPILVILTLPITLLTLGLFLLVINALMLLLAGNMISGFHVQSFWSALFGSIVVSVVTALAHSITDAPERERV